MNAEPIYVSAKAMIAGKGGIMGLIQYEGFAIVGAL